MPKVSVIIPTYNHSDLVKEAIQSVLNQGLTDLEVVVIDDGSIDDTRSVVNEFTDQRVKYYYKNNGGRCTARNLGLIKATGQFIAFLDHDDIWPPNYLNAMITPLEKNSEYDVTYTNITVINPDGNKRELGSPKRRQSGWLTKNFFDSSPCMLPSSSCFRASAWENIFWDEKLSIVAEDYDVFLRISTKSKFLFVPDTHVTKREQVDISERNSLRDVSMIYGALALERFFFRLNGSKYITEKTAKAKISSRFRKAGRVNEKLDKRCSAILLFKKAISYRWLDLRLYFDLLRAWCLNKKNDPEPNWKMPESLPAEITVTQKNI